MKNKEALEVFESGIFNFGRMSGKHQMSEAWVTIKKAVLHDEKRLELIDNYRENAVWFNEHGGYSTNYELIDKIKTLEECEKK